MKVEYNRSGVHTVNAQYVHWKRSSNLGLSWKYNLTHGYWQINRSVDFLVRCSLLHKDKLLAGSWQSRDGFYLRASSVDLAILGDMSWESVHDPFVLFHWYHVQCPRESWAELQGKGGSALMIWSCLAVGGEWGRNRRTLKIAQSSVIM